MAMKSGTEPGDRVNVDEPIAQVETDKVLVLIKLLVSQNCSQVL